MKKVFLSILIFASLLFGQYDRPNTSRTPVDTDLFMLTDQDGASFKQSLNQVFTAALDAIFDDVTIDELVLDSLDIDSVDVNWLKVNTIIVPDENDGASIGTSALQFLGIYGRHIDGDTIVVNVLGGNMDADQNNITDLNRMNVDTVNATILGMGSASINETDITKIDGITNGTQAANKAVIADANANTGISKITQLHIGTSGSETQVTPTAAELNFVDGVTSAIQTQLDSKPDSSTVLYWPDTTVVLTNVKDLIGAKGDSSTVLYWPDTTVALTNVKALIGARADSSTVIYWPDTVDVILTVSDTTTFTARILARADSSTVLYWPDTTSILTNVKDLINARADSSLSLYWPDTTVILTNVKSLIGAKADSSTALYWPDTTVILTNVKDLIGAKSDSSTVIYWADTTLANGVVTNYDISLKENADATLTDIADGTITEDLVNTANPWADNEVADAQTISGGTVNNSVIGGTTAAAGTFTGVTVGSTTAGGNLTVNPTLGTSIAPTFAADQWTCTNGWSADGEGTQLTKVTNVAIGTITPSGSGAIPTADVVYKIVITASAVSSATAITYTYGGVTGTAITATTITDYIPAATTGKLIISGAVNSTATITAISIQALTDNTGDATVYGNLKIGSPIQNIKGTDIITLGITGNVGIRTPSPSAYVHIDAGGGSTTGLKISNLGTANRGIDLNNTGLVGSDDYFIYIDDSNFWNASYQFKTSGWLISNLGLYGSINGVLSMRNTDANGSIDFRTGGDNVGMTISNIGNVGIGTTVIPATNSIANATPTWALWDSDLDKIHTTIATVDTSAIVMTENAISFRGTDADEFNIGINTSDAMVITGATGGISLNGSQINSDALSDVSSVAMLDENETVTGAWKNVVMSFEGWITHDAATDTITIGTLPANALVTNVNIWTSELFDNTGTDEICVGYDGTVEAYAVDVDVSDVGVEIWTPGTTAKTVDGTSRAVKAYYHSDTALDKTTGLTHITINWIQATVSP